MWVREEKRNCKVNERNFGSPTGADITEGSAFSMSSSRVPTPMNICFLEMRLRRFSSTAGAKPIPITQIPRPASLQSSCFLLPDIRGLNHEDDYSTSIRSTPICFLLANANPVPAAKTQERTTCPSLASGKCLFPGCDSMSTLAPYAGFRHT